MMGHSMKRNYVLWRKRMMAHRCFKMSGELNGTGEESGPKRSIAFYVCLVEYHLIKAQIILQPQDSRLKGIEDGFEVQGAQ
jgi:hypothetical protein